jgi:folate-dependent phosphoribosylglycinamide formyltransferase PurN
MRVGFLTAGGTAGVDAVLEDRRRGELYEVACVVPAATSVVPRNLREREEFDRHTVGLLRSLGVDTVFSAGYPWILTEPMLDAFPERIMVVHDGDLTDLDEQGRRRWIGAHAVTEALLAGASATRTSMFVATRDVGNGPLLLVGPRHPVASLVRDAIDSGDLRSVEAYAALHRDWMRRSWSALILRAIELLVAGTLKISRATVWVDGAPGPCRMGEAPDICEALGDAIRRDIPASCPFIQR